MVLQRFIKTESYPQPPPFTWKQYRVRNVLPIYPPPEPLAPPALPSPQRKPSFDAPYTLTTHIIPACYLRTTRPVPLPKAPPATASKEERRAILTQQRIELDTIRTSKVTDGYPQVLWNCVNRYVKKGLNESNRTGLTLSFQHANGFPKEIFEPTLAHLLASPAGRLIDEVWAWESIQHGDAALLNANADLGLFDWTDNSRDILNFLLHFMPAAPTSIPLPTHLTRVSPEETRRRIAHGFSERKFMAIGHSYGGCTSALAAILYPKLFSALYLIDPVILNPDDIRPKAFGAMDLAMGALSRRDKWSSRQEALDNFLKNPFFRVWDPAVLALYVECGIYTTTDASGAPVAQLKMPGALEAVVFAEVHTQHEVFEQLPKLDPRIPLRWAVPGRPGAPELGGFVGATQKRVWLRPENASNVRIAGGGHLIPQEAPQELADDLKDFVIHHFSHLTQSAIKSSL